jgi:hypothetical protein
MGGGGGGVWYGIVLMGVYPIPHCAEIRFVVVLNTTSILCILHFLITLVAQQIIKDK